jgi:hypothetical protein
VTGRYKVSCEIVLSHDPFNDNCQKILGECMYPSREEVVAD